MRGRKGEVEIREKEKRKKGVGEVGKGREAETERHLCKQTKRCCYPVEMYRLEEGNERANFQGALL